MAVVEAVEPAGDAEEPRAVRPRERLVGVDAARGVALLGVFIAHMGVPLALLLTGGVDVHDTEKEIEGLGGTVVEWISIAVSGRSAALFAFLAGISLVLLAGRSRPGTRTERNRVRVRIAVRALILVAIGYGLAVLGSLAVILHFYGVFFLLAIPLLWLRTRHLVALAVAVALIGPQATLAAQYLMPVDGWFQSVSDEEEWTEKDESEWASTWGDPEWAESKEAYWSSLEGSDGEDPFSEEGSLEGMPLFTFDMLEGPLDFLFLGLYPAAVFMAYVLAGMIVARTGLRSRRVRLWLVGAGVGMAALGYGSSWLLLGPLSRFLPEDGEYVSWWSLFEAYSHSNTTVEVVGNTGVAMAVIGLCLLMAETRPARIALYPIGAIGAMTLTLYTAHGVLLWAVYGTLLPAWAWPVETYTVEITLVVSLVFATVWRLTLGAGPMERPTTAISRWAARVVVRDGSDATAPAVRRDPAVQEPAANEPAAKE
ncbi:heparan-alpha-glucosaminide N-acetyltransferase domain-containing protein [Nocardiopsis sp. N85]|uniref:DUF418 domain-containing protein n=1 Tax=Nocardiopsis sp. N85 TaxID=3029400 RepID=UPI00237F19B9|nr:heparan-alpha-glucosaminide N-acetyltransferase domain-containing protein [Nocardiopsis sp. N85]MDE3722291.1 heparan-alpha-glucosaminide N-acetyltransferase domain-containing protein [Nocardiopsis sp. N85]